MSDKINKEILELLEKRKREEISKVGKESRREARIMEKGSPLRGKAKEARDEAMDYAKAKKKYRDDNMKKKKSRFLGMFKKD